MATLLISKGSDVNDLNTFNSTPLHHAVLSGQFDIVDYLIKIGAVVDALTNHVPFLIFLINLTFIILF